MNEELLLSVEDGVAVLTLNRPERLNALTHGMLTGLRTHLTALAEDPSVGCVVLKRTGVDRSVSAKSKLSRIGVSSERFT